MVCIVDVQLINSHKFVVYIHQVYSSLDLQLYVKIDPLVIIRFFLQTRVMNQYYQIF